MLVISQSVEVTPWWDVLDLDAPWTEQDWDRILLTPAGAATLGLWVVAVLVVAFVAVALWRMWHNPTKGLPRVATLLATAVALVLSAEGFYVILRQFVDISPVLAYLVAGVIELGIIAMAVHAERSIVERGHTDVFGRLVFVLALAASVIAGSGASNVPEALVRFLMPQMAALLWWAGARTEQRRWREARGLDPQTGLPPGEVPATPTTTWLWHPKRLAIQWGIIAAGDNDFDALTRQRKRKRLTRAMVRLSLLQLETAQAVRAQQAHGRAGGWADQILGPLAPTARRRRTTQRLIRGIHAMAETVDTATLQEAIAQVSLSSVLISYAEAASTRPGGLEAVLTETNDHFARLRHLRDAPAESTSGIPVVPVAVGEQQAAPTHARFGVGHRPWQQEGDNMSREQHTDEHSRAAASPPDDLVATQSPLTPGGRPSELISMPALAEASPGAADGAGPRAFSGPGMRLQRPAQLGVVAPRPSGNGHGWSAATSRPAHTPEPPAAPTDDHPAGAMTPPTGARVPPHDPSVEDRSPLLVGVPAGANGGSLVHGDDDEDIDDRQEGTGADRRADAGAVQEEPFHLSPAAPRSRLEDVLREATTREEVLDVVGADWAQLGEPERIAVCMHLMRQLGLQPADADVPHRRPTNRRLVYVVLEVFPDVAPKTLQEAVHRLADYWAEQGADPGAVESLRWGPKVAGKAKAAAQADLATAPADTHDGGRADNEGRPSQWGTAELEATDLGGAIAAGGFAVGARASIDRGLTAGLGKGDTGAGEVGAAAEPWQDVDSDRGDPRSSADDPSRVIDLRDRQSADSHPAATSPVAPAALHD